MKIESQALKARLNDVTTTVASGAESTSGEKKLDEGCGPLFKLYSRRGNTVKSWQRFRRGDVIVPLIQNDIWDKVDDIYIDRNDSKD